MMNDTMTGNGAGGVEGFYAACAELIGSAHEYREVRVYPRFDRLTFAVTLMKTSQGRWAPRVPGNGRFPGFGLIRRFGADRIHISGGGINRVCRSESEALDVLRAWAARRGAGG